MKPEDYVGRIFLRYTVGPNYQPIPLFLQVVEVKPNGLLVAQRIPGHFEEDRGFMPVPDLFDGDDRLINLWTANKAIDYTAEIYALYNPPDSEKGA